MKVHEIVFSPASADLGDLEDVLSSLTDKNEVAKRLNSKQQIGKSGNKLTFMYDGKIVGYLSLGAKVSLDGKKYLPIKMIYILPRFRKTFALGLFIMGISQAVEYPIVVGVDNFGGALSPDGAELVKSLGKKKQYTVRALNINTGEEREIEDSDFTSDNHAITFAFYGNQLPLKVAEDELSEFGITFWLFEDTLNKKLYEVE